MQFGRDTKISGFSLLELMIYIGISGGLLSFGLFQIGALRNLSILRSSSTAIQTILLTKQQHALLSGDTSSLLFQGNIIVDQTNSRTLRRFNPKLSILAKFGQLHLKQNIFTAYAGGVVSPGTIKLKLAEKTCVLRVALRGNSTLECS